MKSQDKIVNQVSLSQIILYFFSKWKIIIGVTIFMTMLGYVASRIIVKDIWQTKLIFIVKNNTPIETLFGVYKSPQLLSPESIEEIFERNQFTISLSSDNDVEDHVDETSLTEVDFKVDQEHSVDDFLTIQAVIKHKDSVKILDLANSYYKNVVEEFDGLISRQVYTYFSTKLKEDIRYSKSEIELINSRLKVYDSISENSKPTTFMQLETNNNQFVLTNPKYIDITNEILILQKAKADFQTKIEQFEQYLNNYFDSEQLNGFPKKYSNQFVSLMSDTEKVTKTSTINVKKNTLLIALASLFLICLFFFLQLLMKEESDK